MYRIATEFSAAEASARGASAELGLAGRGAGVGELCCLNRPRRPRPPLGGPPIDSNDGYKAGTQRQVDYSIVEGRRFAIAGIRTREPVGAGSN